MGRIILLGDIFYRMIFGNIRFCGGKIVCISAMLPFILFGGSISCISTRLTFILFGGSVSCISTMLPSGTGGS